MVGEFNKFRAGERGRDKKLIRACFSSPEIALSRNCVFRQAEIEQLLSVCFIRGFKGSQVGASSMVISWI